jgi:predicted nucleic acid-binding protein
VQPLNLDRALRQVRTWISLPGVQIIHPSGKHAQYFTNACQSTNAAGNLVTDAHLAALAMEHDCELASSDTDFAKFPGLRWINPLAAALPSP